MSKKGKKVKSKKIEEIKPQEIKHLKDYMWVFYLVLAVFIITLLSMSNKPLFTGEVIGIDFIGDLSGTWQLEEISDQTDCNEGIQRDSYTVSITQVNEKITISSSRYSLKGELVKDNLGVSGSFPDDGGVTDFRYTNVIIDPDCNSFKGTGEWNWSDNKNSCKGPIEISGTRDNAIGCGRLVTSASSAPKCEEDWECNEWGSCKNGERSRTCTDKNNCGTEEEKPGEGEGCEKAAPKIDITSLMFTLLWIILTILILAIIYLSLAIRSKKKRIVKRIEAVINKIHEDLNIGDKIGALNAYRDLIGMFDRYKEDLSKRDVRKLFTEGKEAYDILLRS